MSSRRASRIRSLALVALSLALPVVGRAGEAPTPPIFRTGRATPPAGAHLLYFGGRVLSEVELVMVLWGGGAYAPYVTGSESPSLPEFLAALAGSPFVIGLAEYDTAREAFGGLPGTGQHIGPGRFGGAVRIAPSAGAEVVDDAAIAAELGAQLARGALPPPRADAQGNLETLYLVYFPAGKRITLGGDESCRSFCAFHGTFEWMGRPVPYAVFPDLSPGSGCELACGAGTPFADAAAIASHELAEAVTDPDVARATAAGPPLGWYDPLNGEIADLCVGETGVVHGADGVGWPVQRVWSNARGGCVVPVASLAPTLVAAASPPASEARRETPVTLPELLDPRPVAARPVAAMPILTAAPPVALQGAALAPPRVRPPDPSPPMGKRFRLAIREDNDALGVRRPAEDEFYTQGLHLSARWALTSDAEAEREGRLDELGFAIGQNIYTPSNVRTTDLAVLRHDRPYAGWLFAALLLRIEATAPGALRLGADAAGDGSQTIDLALAAGVTGRWSLASDVQVKFHAFLEEGSGMAPSRPDPAGWSVYQIATMPTLDLSFRYQFDLVQASVGLGSATASSGSVLGVRLSPRARLDAGSTLDAVSLGMELRAGLLSPSPLRPRAPRPFALYGYARADGRYVLWNGLIEGPLQNGVLQLVELQPWVADLEAGIVLRAGSLELGYGQLFRTAEVRPLPPGARRVHDVGQLTVAWIAP